MRGPLLAEPTAVHDHLRTFRQKCLVLLSILLGSGKKKRFFFQQLMPKDRRVNIEGPGIHRFPRAENCRHESGIANSALSPIHAGGAEKFGTLFPTLSCNLSPRLGRSFGLLSSSRRGDLLFGVRVFFAWRPVWCEVPPPGRSGKEGRSWVSNTCRTDFEIALARILEYLPGRLECDVRRGYPQICALNCQPGQTLEKKVGNMCTRLKRESMRVRFHINIAKKLARSEQPRICVESHCANIGRFGTMLLLCGFATGCNKTHWHGRA
jgi:hypothetical protein